MYDEHYNENNNITNNNIFNNNYFYTNNTIVQSNNMKRPVSYNKNIININSENYKLENSNEKKNINLNINNNNDNYIKSINIINDKKKRNLTPIKINYHYLIKEKTPIKLNEKLNLNIINNGVGNNKLISHICKTNNNIMPIINNVRNSPDKGIKEYYNINIKPIPYKQIQVAQNEGHFVDKFKEKENKDHMIYKMEEQEQNQFMQKFCNIKSPLKQLDSKISANNTQNNPEVISNYPSQNSQNNEKFYKKCNYFRENDNSKCDILISSNINNKNYYNNGNNQNLNEDIHIKEENNNLINKINLKTNNNMINDKLLKPKGLFFQKKLLKNISSINIHKRPVSNIITRSMLNNNSDNISKIFDNYNNNNIAVTNNNNNYKINSKIKLKPISPFVRSITPFNDNNHKKYDLKVIKNKNILNLPNKIYNNNNSITDLNNQNNTIEEISNNNIKNNINDKSYFIRDKKNIRQLNINKNKINNLSQIKTKFLNYIKPNYKNIEMINHKTEI